MAFWWCLKHAAVEGSEHDNRGCADDDRLGPYDSATQAQGALQSVKDRTAAEDARDKAEDDW